MDELAEYYRKRAAEYDAFYADPERAADLATLRAWLAVQVHGRHVLEVACGTGYWTAAAASTAAAITATDINAEMLAIARQRGLSLPVAWQTGDARDLPALAGAFDCGMAHLWWSHLRRQDRGAFLAGFAARLQPRALLLLIDENLVPHVGAPIVRTDAEGNTYQRRWLASGERFEVLKNYPGEAELRHDLGVRCDVIGVMQLRHFWAVAALRR